MTTAKLVLLVVALVHAPACRQGYQWSASADRCIKTTDKPSFSSHCGWAGRSPGWCVK